VRIEATAEESVLGQLEAFDDSNNALDLREHVEVWLGFGGRDERHSNQLSPTAIPSIVILKVFRSLRSTSTDKTDSWTNASGS
jgi:hypothetical protein